MKIVVSGTHQTLSRIAGCTVREKVLAFDTSSILGTVILRQSTWSYLSDRCLLAVSDEHIGQRVCYNLLMRWCLFASLATNAVCKDWVDIKRLGNSCLSTTAITLILRRLHQAVKSNCSIVEETTTEAECLPTWYCRIVIKYSAIRFSKLWRVHVRIDCASSG